MKRRSHRTVRTGTASGIAPGRGLPPAGTDDPRERILAAARRHFLSLGFARCTMDCLATELGMSKKTLYQHFRRKEQIVDELMARKAAAVHDGFHAILAAPDLAFAERAARMLRHAHDEFSEVSAIFLHDLRRFHPAGYARLEEFRARVAPGIWGTLLRSGIEAGAVRPDVDPAFVGHLLPSIMQSLLHPETLQRFALQPHEMLQRFFHLLFTGVLTPQGLAEHAHYHTPR